MILLRAAARAASRLALAGLLAACATDPGPDAGPIPCGGDTLSATAVPAQLADGLLVVSAEVNGQPARLRVDTGANLLLMLWENAARDLGVPTRPAGRGDTLAGAVRVRQGEVSELRLGSLALSDVPVAVLPQRSGTGAEGQLGVLLLELGDLLHGLPRVPTAVLIESEGCEQALLAALAGGPGEVVAVPLTQPHREAGNGYLFATLEVEGTPLTALIDTGMTATALTQAGLKRLGRARPVLRRTQVRNIDGRTAPAELRRFAHVAFGPLKAREAELLVLPDGALTRRFGIEAFIGADLLMTQPALISARSRTLYLWMPAEAGS